MQKAIIIDDERLARNELKKLLQEFPEVEVIGEAANANEGIEKIESLNPDLIFLDIQMPGKTGFDMLTQIERAPHVIFVTAYDEYALKAFKVNSVDYLLKPVKKDDLALSFQKLYKLKHLYAGNALPLPDFRTLIKELQEQNRLKEYRERFLVKHGQRLISIETNDIQHIVLLGNKLKTKKSVKNHYYK